MTGPMKIDPWQENWDLDSTPAPSPALRPFFRIHARRKAITTKITVPRREGI
jgi:hypothetical protein